VRNLEPGSVTQCYSTGKVSGKDHVGALAAWNYGGRVTASFWDIQTSGQATSDGGTGKTTAQMQTAKTFLDAGWDFVGEAANGTEDLWWILEGKDYPRLWWENAGQRNATADERRWAWRGFGALSRNQRCSEGGILFDRSYCVWQEHARRIPLCGLRSQQDPRFQMMFNSPS